MRMVNDAQRQLAVIDFVHHREVFLRLHQEGGACVARERRGVFGVHRVLDVGDGADFFDRIVADDEAAAFERKLALGLCDDSRPCSRDVSMQASSAFLFPLVD